MATFVLVPGGWLGGWVWTRVAAGLRAKGHVVHPVTLTGLGDRSHLGLADLSIHVADVSSVLHHEDIEDAVLVGHSYGGVVSTQVLEECHARIRHLVYLDAIVPRDGEDVVGAMGAAGGLLAGLRHALDAEDRRRGDGRFGFVPPLEDWLLGDDLEWVRERVVAHPVATQTDPVRLGSPGATAVPKSYILLVEALRPMAERVRADGGEVHELLETVRGPVGHYGMLTAAEEVTVLLERIASGYLWGRLTGEHLFGRIVTRLRGLGVTGPPLSR